MIPAAIAAPIALAFGIMVTRWHFHRSYLLLPKDRVLWRQKKGSTLELDQ